MSQQCVDISCFTNLFWPRKFKKNEEVTLNYFLKNNINMSGTTFLQLDKPQT